MSSTYYKEYLFNKNAQRTVGKNEKQMSGKAETLKTAVTVSKMTLLVRSKLAKHGKK